MAIANGDIRMLDIATLNNHIGCTYGVEDMKWLFMVKFKDDTSSNTARTVMRCCSSLEHSRKGTSNSSLAILHIASTKHNLVCSRII